MMLFDKHKAVETIMSRRRNGDGSTSEAPMKATEIKSEDGNPDPRHEAAKDIMSAIHEKHPGKLMEAMAAFHDLHMMHKDDAEEPSEAE